MAMNPRLLRPKASGGPVFTTQGYARVWGVTTKSTGNVTGTAETDTGYYAVKWWDNTTTVYDSGDTFSKAAAGNQRAFEVYPCDSGGVASGQFDGFDISSNALTRVRSEGVTLADGVAGYYNWSNYTYVSGSPAESAILYGNLLSAAALDEFYTDLDAGDGYIFVSGNPGIAADTPTIATAKGYTVFGSVPPGTSLLLNFNGTNGSTTFTDSSPNGLTVTANGNAEISTAQSKFGGASAKFVRTGDFSSGEGYLTADASGGKFTLGGENFTIEAWVFLEDYPTSGGYPNSYWICGWGPQDSNPGFDFYFTDSDIAINLTDFTSPTASGSHGMLLQTWHHVAATRSGNVIRLFVDGVEVASATSSDAAAPPDPSDLIAISGAEPTNSTGGTLSGYIDDLRIVKGFALYTANFTPPTAQLGVYP